ncbi:MAG: penicillin acylase family protein [Pseudomonadota bacterium]
MNRFLRGAIGVVLVILVIIAVIIAWLAGRFVATQPQTEGQIALAGVSDEAHIIRDEHGVPHIFGETDADVFFALGYAHAQDRFFQMDLARRAVQGRLAELFGERAVRVDARARNRLFPQAAQAVLDNGAEETRAAVEAYVAGVNARLQRGAPSPEYAILRKPVEAWTALDTASITIYLADDLAAGGFDETERLLLADVLSAEQLEQWLSPFPDWAVTTLKDADITAQGPRPAAAPDEDALAQPDNLPGSNAWVVSGERTGTGAPLLANDPHLSLAAPSIWYFTRLQLDHGPVVGGTVPGSPFVILGRNAHGAWGFTNTGFDVIDYVPVDPDTLQITAEHEETIRVSGGEDITFTVRETAIGPVLDPDWFNLDGFDGQAVILRSTVHSDQNGVADATFKIMHSRGWDDFVEAGRTWTAPMQNMHYAGVDGTIGYTTAGLLPIRDAAGDWIGFVPFEDLPRVRNPQGGVIASGNNLPAGEAYPYPLPGSYSVFRAPRIEVLLAETETHDAQSFAAIQLDVTSYFAQRILPALLAGQPRTELGMAALERMEDWDASLDADGAEGLIYSAWLEAFTEALFADELGEAFPARFSSRRGFIDSVINGGAFAWCDDVTTEARETCPDLAGPALDEAMAETAAQHGADMDAWRWGEVHQGLFDHPLTGTPLIGETFTVRAPMGGDGSTVNVAHFSYRTPGYDVFHAASMRAIYDLADLDASLFMHAPGQSGHPLSPHYRDLAPLFSDGEFITIPTGWGPESAAETMRVLTLKPL